MHRSAVPAILLAFGLVYGSADATGKTAIDLQLQKTLEERSGKDVDGKALKATLTNLNPAINSWFVLKTVMTVGNTTKFFHIENSNPKEVTIRLATNPLLSLEITNGEKTSQCPISVPELTSLLESSFRDSESYAPICDRQLYLRIAITGRQSSKEAVSSFLRKHVWGGDEITTLVKETLYQDSFMLESVTTTKQVSEMPGDSDAGPPAGKIEKSFQGKLVSAVEMGIPVSEVSDGNLIAGRWYQSSVDDAVFVSAVEPGILNTQVLNSYTDRVAPLDPVEKKAIAYLVAFDMDKFSAGFAIGTDSPSVEWSNRVMQEFIKSAPGPDGFETIYPLVGTGKIRPDLVGTIAATFTGGFKRMHGAFRQGEFATVNNGSHYGFIESGTILSTLQPGLATAIVDSDGHITLKTWEEEDNANTLPKVLHARQNGVAIIEKIDPDFDMPIPGRLVNKWGPGNWSGSTDSRQRALRAGLCSVTRGNRKFLIYGYFSTATPNAMARVFQAYQCEYAFHLDMNALEHTYLSTYSIKDRKLKIHNLIRGMSALDRYNSDNDVSPRFIGISDNRDFFYLQRVTAITVKPKIEPKAEIKPGLEK
jgi:hypothetical protein